MALARLNLKDRDYHVAEGPDIRGWRLDDCIGLHAGRVVSLLYDPETGWVRDVVVDMSGRWLQLPLAMFEVDETRQRLVATQASMSDMLAMKDHLLGYATQAYYTDRDMAHPGNEGAEATFDPEREFREPAGRHERI